MADPYAEILVPPARAAAGVCDTCRAFTARRRARCGPCRRQPAHLDAVVPISYSAGGGRWHRELRAYKDDRCEAVRDLCTQGLATVLDRFLIAHERCVAAAAGADELAVVTTVPSRTARADAARSRLREIVGHHCPATRGRYRRVLRAGASPVEAHRWVPGRFSAVSDLGAAAVLLVDDTWTTGASAQDAARALKLAGASRVALIALGRHVNPGFSDHGARLAALPAFDWSWCAAHAWRGPDHGRAGQRTENGQLTGLVNR